MESLRDRLNGAPPQLTGDEVLDAYGRRGSTQEILAPGNDIIRTSAERMISDTMSALVAAEGILEMLRVDAETFTSEVRHHSNNLAARMSTYIECCQTAANAMQQHRESILKVAATIADEPTSLGVSSEPRE